MKIKTCGRIAFLASLVSLMSCSTWAASDNAGNYSSFANGLQNTTGTQASGGTGFGSWQFINSDPNGGYAGEFLGSSVGSGNTSSYNINSPANGDSWGFYANQATQAEAQAIAPFSGGSLAVRQTFSVQMQNYDIDTGATNGFRLQTSSGASLFQFYFVGGQSDYYINIAGGQVNTGVPYTANGLSLSFTQEAGNSWSFVISGPTVTTTTLTSSSTGYLLPTSDLSRVDLFDDSGTAYANSPNTGDYNTFFNNIQVVPEPSSLSIMAVSGLGALFMFRRRK